MAAQAQEVVTTTKGWLPSLSSLVPGRLETLLEGVGETNAASVLAEEEEDAEDPHGAEMDEDEDEDEDNEDENEDVPEGVEKWVRMTFPQFIAGGGHAREKMFLYDVIRETPEDSESMAEERRWKMEVRNVSVRNENMELGDFFLKFAAPYDFVLKKKYAVEKSLRVPGEQHSFMWVERGSRGNSYSTSLCRNLEKHKRHEFLGDVWATEFGNRMAGVRNALGLGHGRTAGISYFDLMSSSLRVELWRYSQLLPNTFVVAADIPLVDIAKGSMVIERELFDAAAPRRRIAKRVYASVKFVCIFQSVCDFKLEFARWACDFHNTTDSGAALQSIDPVAQIRSKVILNPVVGMVLKSRLGKRAVARPISSEAVDPTEFVLGDGNFIPVIFECTDCIRVRCTKQELEQMSLGVTLYHQPLISVLRKRTIGHVDIPLKGVVLTGSLQAEVGYDQHVGLNATSSSSSIGGGDTRPDFASAGTVRGIMNIRAGRRVASYVHVSESEVERETRLWKMFLQKGEPNPPDLDDEESVYLAIAPQTITLTDPDNFPSEVRSQYANVCVQAEWAGQSQTTDTIKQLRGGGVAQCMDVLYFHVRSFGKRPTRAELERVPSILLTVWHEDDNGTRVALGSTKVWLHDITGRMARSEDALEARKCAVGKCEERPLEKLTIMRKPVRTRWSLSFLSHGPRLDVETTVKTRVLRDVAVLVSQTGNRLSSVKFEAYFRGPFFVNPLTKERTNIVDLLDVTRDEGDGWWPPLKLPHMDAAEERTMKALCVCKIESPASNSGITRKCERSRSGHMEAEAGATAGASGIASSRYVVCDQLAAFETTVRYHFCDQERLFRRYRPIGRRDRKNGVMHWSYIAALDEHGVYRLLPEFLRETSTPKDFYLHERASTQSSALGQTGDLVLKPQVAYELMQFVRAIRFSYEDNFKSGDAGTVSETSRALLHELRLPIRAQSPKTMLLRRVGDVRDHALLLCSFFIGCGFDAYVCIGSARVSRPAPHRRPGLRGPVDSTLAEEADHVWVMTRATPVCGKQLEGFTDGSMEEESPPRSALRQIEEEAFTVEGWGDVHFYELTNGLVYRLRQRFRSKRMQDGLKKEMRTEWKQSMAAQKDGEVGDADDDADGTKQVREADVLNFLRSDVKKRTAVDEIFLDGVGSGDKWGTPTEEELIRSFNRLRDQSRRGRKLKVAEETAADHDRIRQPTEYDDLLLHINNVNKRHPNWRKGHRRMPTDSIGQPVPYTKLKVVFNHKNLWVNCHQHPNPAKGEDVMMDDPMLLAYDFPDAVRADTDALNARQREQKNDQRATGCGWLSFCVPPFRGDSIVPFFGPVAITPVMPSERVHELEASMTTMIEQAIINVRENASEHGVTRFNSSTKLVASLHDVIGDVLVAKARYELFEERTSVERLTEAENPACLRAAQEYYARLLDLAKTNPPGFRFRIAFFKVNSASPEEVRVNIFDKTPPHRTIAEGVTESVSKIFMLGTDVKERELWQGQEMFSVAVKVDANICGVVTTRVGIMAVYPDPR